ncbi:hypothetical protein LEP1GSC165_3959 [Leptospira santarosai str. CBC523]|uniref:hypothetical protein n=1 Tax=Leptospira santarosai TaxID=28183 RepID=UPI0002BEEA62|nr:hypothetical protein [Leptospira santarosai]EMO12127.1 hypothetical protein LEP1GSC165_3959 [Leptospira santarosai str. CBC523]
MGQVAMNMSEKLDLEEIIRTNFNKIYNASTEKKELSPSKTASKHEFDIYEKGKYIGGINSSKRLTSTGNNNTGGQDRVSSEILWLSLWKGKEKRILILTDLGMQEYIRKKYKDWEFPYNIEVICFDEQTLCIVGETVILQ